MPRTRLFPQRAPVSPRSLTPDPLTVARGAAVEPECRLLEAVCMRFRFVSPFLALALLVVQPGAPSAQQPAPAPSKPEPTANTYASTYRPFPSRATVIRNATILTAAGPVIERGAILVENGKISAVGQSVTAPEGAIVIDAAGKWVTPGIIDTHSHL